MDWLKVAFAVLLVVILVAWLIAGIRSDIASSRKRKRGGEP